MKGKTTPPQTGLLRLCFPLVVARSNSIRVSWNFMLVISLPPPDREGGFPLSGLYEPRLPQGCLRSG